MIAISKANNETPLINDISETINQTPIEPPFSTTTTNETVTSSLVLKLGGCPKGSTVASVRTMSSKIAKTKFDAMVLFLHVRQLASANGKQAPWGFLQSCIEKARKENGIPNYNDSINCESIQSQAKFKILYENPQPGGGSPMAGMEPYLVDLILQLATSYLSLSFQFIPSCCCLWNKVLLLLLM